MTKSSTLWSNGAGVRAWRRLRLLQIQGWRVVVLEARDRIGGRVVTERSGWPDYRSGGIRIHGIDDAPLQDAVWDSRDKQPEFSVGSFHVQPADCVLRPGTVVGFSDDDVAAFVDDPCCRRDDTTQSLGGFRNHVWAGRRGRIGGDRLGNRDVERVREFPRHRTEEQ